MFTGGCGVRCAGGADQLSDPARPAAPLTAENRYRSQRRRTIPQLRADAYRVTSLYNFPYLTYSHFQIQRNLKASNAVSRNYQAHDETD